MTYQDNMHILSEYFPEAYRVVAGLKNQQHASGIHLFGSPAGCKNLKINYTFLHNKMNPLVEARQLIEQFSNINKHSDILFYGIGLAYHVKYFAERYPDIPFFIYEPLPALFDQFLRCQELNQLPLSQIKGIYLEESAESSQQACSDIINKVRKSILIITLPAYQKAFVDRHRAFLADFEARLSERRNTLATNAQYQKRWTSNSINNFPRVLMTTNLLMEKAGSFLNKPAILAASGPSLDAEIENLRLIKDKKLAYIFTAGTALNALVRNNIHPHAAFTYDPSHENQIVCKEVSERGIDFIPLIFGSTVGSETLANYPGPQLHVISNQDFLSRHYLRSQSGEAMDYINDASTISIFALQVLFRLGFNPLILVGQNLAYQERRRYAAGSTYHPETTSEEDLRDAVMVQDVNGSLIPSNQNFVRMRQQLEYYLSSFQTLEVLNTTQNGAHIQYTCFMPLDDLMRTRLLDETVDENWLPLYICRYDLAYLEQETRLFNQAYQQVMPLLDKCLQSLDDIRTVTSDGDAVVINRSYEAFNHDMAELRANIFMASFIEPMNRVELELLMLAVPSISRERKPQLKAKMMESEFRSYLLSCRNDIAELGASFLQMNNFARKFCQENRVRRSMKKIKLLLLEGVEVLTGRYVFYSSSGEELRRVNWQDKLAIETLLNHGIKIMLVEVLIEPGLKKLTRKIGILGTTNSDLERSLGAILTPLDYQQIACIGCCGTGLREPFGVKLAVQDAEEASLREADYILESRSGQGALHELAQLIFKSTI